jgi:hypothetical protein
VRIHFHGDNYDSQVLWWAARFLNADLSRDYAGQQRWLAPGAEAFGARGHE